MRHVLIFMLLVSFVPLFSISLRNTEKRAEPLLSGLSFSIGYANSWVSHNNPTVPMGSGNTDTPLSFKSVGSYSIGVSLVDNPYLSSNSIIVEPSVRYIVRGYQSYLKQGEFLRSMIERKLHYIEPYFKVKLNTSDGVILNPFIGAGISLLTRVVGHDYFHSNLTISYEKYDVFLMAGFDLTFIDRFIVGFDYSLGFRNILYDFGVEEINFNQKPTLFNNTINVSVGLLF